MALILFLIPFLHLWVFSSLRSILSHIIVYLTSRKAYERRKRRQTLKEWYLWSRFRLEIPKYHLITYLYILPIFTGFWLIVCIIGFFCTSDIQLILSAIIFLYYVIFDIIYSAYSEGIHWKNTYIYHPEKIKYRGVNRSEYIKAKTIYKKKYGALPGDRIHKNPKKQKSGQSGAKDHTTN